ncbi:hypothetical protein TRFO_31060 [Tritrichomonas foetus]|uniref:Protein kinase domain-containing protein n=1 Tax=Tritrichomonas foetus TaxID=1144522 RepID=A0A1J4JWR9_9EUKA|nr:hypothetical protein TRFO_31060 [Tritrichomonas foetus]|eukprot:OHT01980.1 hypothetical protein TRFO_31060 [Tritrichomonas foetus]
MATGKFPFYDENVSNVLQKIVYSDPYFPPTISSQFSDLIKKMLVKQPENRITLEMIKRHPWFSLPEYQRMCDFIKENLNASNFTSPFSNTNISQSFSRSSISDQVIDPEIVTRMTEMGIDVGNLKVCLFMRNHTEATAVYKMLRRHKLIEKMKDGVKINLKEKMRPDKLTIVTAHPDNGSTDDIPQSAPTDGKRSLLSPRIISRSTRIQNIQKRFSHDIKNSDKKRNT